MKTCFFVNMVKPLPETFKNKLREYGYVAFETKSHEEIDQAGKQCQQLILFFDEPKFAYKFLKENHWIGFRLLNILILPKKPKLSLENQRMLTSVSLQVFGMEEVTSLISIIKNFENQVEEDIEIEFTVNNDLKGN
jgi:hypothetical protein